MEINPFQLRLIAEATAELGALSALILTGQVKPYLNRSEAFKRFGRAKVENWVHMGLISVHKDGDHSAAWRIERFRDRNSRQIRCHFQAFVTAIILSKIKIFIV
ncbi:hypothetical protein [Mucilaginibacter sp. 21P]|uniref:hypothetical protein n=1 Tax=Mucilaginibacter sp. 21P TaxID=2778902 RepID=UPI0021031315|nr:hypothetical protein [Mucilaginibacter sp. 21P]